MDIIPPQNRPDGQTAYQVPAEPPPAAPGGPPLADPPKNDRRHSFRGLASTAGLFISAFLIAILLNTFVIQSYQVDGESMEPTLQNDDRLIVNKIPRTISRIDGRQYVPKRSEIIIFNEDNLPGFVGQKQLIKRVIGLPGEHVVVASGKITIYNAQFPGGFNPDASGKYQTAAATTVGDVDLTLQQNEIFVCGDNRPNSEDSRYFGPVNTNQVVAKLVLRILPLNKSKSF